MKCNDCGTTFSGSICPCGWKPAAYANKQDLARCCMCGGQREVKTMISITPEKPVCRTCYHRNAATEGMEPWEKEHVEKVAQTFNLPLGDMRMHLQAANIKGMKLHEYCRSLPKNRAEFEEQNPQYKGQFREQ